MGRSGSRDLLHARSRAARELGIRDPSALPDEAELQQALRDYLQLFAAQPTHDALDRKRRAALQAMEFFAAFRPRLTGPVLAGSATPSSPVQLHLHSDEPEAVQRFLLDQQVPVTLASAEVILDNERRLPVTRLDFRADEEPFELWVLPERALRQPPRLPGASAPLERASLAQLQALIATG